MHLFAGRSDVSEHSSRAARFHSENVLICIFWVPISSVSLEEIAFPAGRKVSGGSRNYVFWFGFLLRVLLVSFAGLLSHAGIERIG